MISQMICHVAQLPNDLAETSDILCRSGLVVSRQFGFKDMHVIHDLILQRAAGSISFFLISRKRWNKAQASCPARLPLTS
jgi:hypothetical protein